jgi:hypothetical protein
LIINLIQQYNYDVPLTWLDVELHTTTGIDISQHRFPNQQGSQVHVASPYHGVNTCKTFIPKEIVGLFTQNGLKFKNTVPHWASMARSAIDAGELDRCYTRDVHK